MLNARGILERLEGHYGPRNWVARREPLHELIETILAQHTSDLNAERAFKDLWAAFGSWQAIADADVEAIADSIRSGGLARQKAPRVKAVLEEIRRRRGAFDLTFLEALPFAEALSWLTSLNGVGPKTARCVLLFALGKPCIPVDTHVHRVARRLGLVPDRMTAEAAHPVLEEAVAPEDCYRFHVYFIEHGRALCRAPRPLCGGCILKEECPSSLVPGRGRLRARRSPAGSGSEGPGPVQKRTAKAPKGEGAAGRASGRRRSPPSPPPG